MLRWAFRLVGAAALAFCAGFLVFAAVASQPASSTDTADGIVALTGGEARIDEALRLLADHRAKRLLISGVNPRTTRSALERLTPEYTPLFDCCVDIGRWAQDTVENADEAQGWARQRGFTSLIVVTSGYHMARSLTELGRAMPDVELIPHPVLVSGQRAEAWWTSASATRLLMVEYLKLLPALARRGAARLFSADPAPATASILIPPRAASDASLN